jgi:putative hemolysin
MKFTIPSSVTFLAIVAVSNNARVVQGVLSPAVTCCKKNGGSYEIVDGGDAICLKDGSYVEANTFMSNNCPPDEEYEVYAYNSCTSTVGAEFTLNDNYNGGAYEVDVYLEVNACKIVGFTDQADVTYEEVGSYASGGQSSCKAIGNSQNDQCGDIKNLPANSCVIDMC